MIRKWFKNLGPGTLVAAAFIGPGTVTVCSIAGVNFGYNLLWVMLLSIVATIILQEMASRVGVITQKGLSEIIREEIKIYPIRIITIVLILFAIVIGNAAYEAGNIGGSILGLETIFGEFNYEYNSLKINLWSIIIGFIAFILLYIGNYKFLEKALITLVVFMSISFLITALITKPNISDVLGGLFVPKFPDKSLLTIIGLIGTTIVPYNLFLHASLVKEKWKSKEDLPKVRRDTVLSIMLGGFVSISIIISAATVQLSEITSAADLAKGLEPLYGKYSKYFLSLGLFAAGITSAITAPLAAAYVVKECLGWKVNLKSKKFRMVWIIILFLGVMFSSIGIKPIEIIKFAQIANGMLLPIIASILLWIMNKKSILGVYTNSKFQNITGFVIVIFALFLGTKGILTVFKVL